MHPLLPQRCFLDQREPKPKIAGKIVDRVNADYKLISYNVNKLLDNRSFGAYWYIARAAETFTDPEKNFCVKRTHRPHPTDTGGELRPWLLSYRAVVGAAVELDELDGVVAGLWPGAFSDWPGLFCANVKVRPPSPAHVPGTAVPLTSRA
jgi:hypothetical protein